MLSKLSDFLARNYHPWSEIWKTKGRKGKKDFMTTIITNSKTILHITGGDLIMFVLMDELWSLAEADLVRPPSNKTARSSSLIVSFSNSSRLVSEWLQSGNLNVKMFRHPFQELNFIFYKLITILFYQDKQPFISTM